MRRLLIAGGGTGGHLFPGLAVAEIWESREGNGDLLFVGTSSGIESRILPEQGRALATLRVGRIKGRGFARRLATLLGLPVAVREAAILIRKFRPSVVLGVGGYASAPVVMAARILRIPTAIHEQNALPGLANRWLSRWVGVDRVLLSFSEAKEGFPEKKIRITGNPVRAMFHNRPITIARRDQNCFRLLVFGGSQGAEVFSRVVPNVVAALMKSMKSIGTETDLHVLHQTRHEDVTSLENRYRKNGVKARVVSFIDAMDEAYEQADFVICRAGATSVAELSIVGRPALLVPFPDAADDHQTANARALVQTGGAWMQPQPALTAQWLEAFLKERLSDHSALKSAGDKVSRLARPNAAEEIVMTLEMLSEGNQRDKDF